MKLSKPWVWRENAVIYTHPSQVIHEPYPFYWYRATGLQIELVKQVSKFCGIVQDWNEYIVSLCSRSCSRSRYYR
jgi:uncharacterized protein YcfL